MLMDEVATCRYIRTYPEINHPCTVDAHSSSANMCKAEQESSDTHRITSSKQKYLQYAASFYLSHLDEMCGSAPNHMNALAPQQHHYNRNENILPNLS